MREIKFRAWSKEDKKMSVVNSLIRPYGEQNMYVGDHDPSGCPKWDDDILMQYTGLKDKNGKEIYEGDVLKLVMPDGLEENDDGDYVYDEDGALIDKFKEEIVYIKYCEENNYELKAFYSNDTKWDNGQSYEDWDDRFYDSHEVRGLEVIGDIYTTPDLLKEQS